MELFTAYVGSVLEKAVDKPLSTPVHTGQPELFFFVIVLIYFHWF